MIQTLTLLIFIVIGGAITILPASFGSFEIAVIYVLSTFHYPLHVAAIIGIGLHISQISIVPLYGMWIMIKEDLGIQQSFVKLKSNVLNT